MLITGPGPIVILTSYDSVVDAALIKKRAGKGIEKFIAYRFRSVLLKNAMVRISRSCRGTSGKPTILRVLDYDPSAPRERSSA
jgi:hypothetical protein